MATATPAFTPGLKRYLIRAYQFVMPFHQLRPSTTTGAIPRWLATSGCQWTTTTPWYTTGNTAHGRATERGRPARTPSGQWSAGCRSDDLPLARDRANNYLLDRQAQKTRSFTGIEGVNTQDRAVQESMGRIVDRSKEHLGQPTRPLSRRAACSRKRSRRPGGGTPAWHGGNVLYAAAAEGVIPREADWRELFTSETDAVEILQTV